MKYAPNVIKTDFGSYRHFWRGTIKIGKTTMFRDVTKEAYGDYKHGLLISVGVESGHKAIDGIYVEEAGDWRDFLKVVTDLVENPDDNEFEIIGIDTVDELVSIAIERTLYDHYRRKNEKVDSINKAFGGYGNGQKHAVNLIRKQIKRIEDAGYGLVFIGHTKIKDIKERGMDEPYQVLTTNLESRFGNIFADRADIIATFSSERTVGEKGFETERFIYFRENGFVDAGSRFNNMPGRVEMTAENYLKAFNQGVMSSFEGGISDAKLKKIKKEERVEKNKKAKQYSKMERSGSIDEFLEGVQDYKDAIADALDTMPKDKKRQVQSELKDSGVPTNWKKSEDIEVLKIILKKVNE